MSGAAPLAESDVDPLYSKFDIDPNALKFTQGKCFYKIESLNRVFTGANYEVRI